MELFWWCGIFWFRLWNSSGGVVFSGLDYGTLLMVWYFLVYIMEIF
jgi:hypothetical protein